MTTVNVGSRIKVVCGDRDTVMFDPDGKVISINGDVVEIQLDSGITFKVGMSGFMGHSPDILLVDPISIPEWVPACGGTETPFFKGGKKYLYMWNQKTREHAYYCITDDLFVEDIDRV